VGSVQEAFGVEADAGVLIKVHDPCQEHVEVHVAGAFLGWIVREVVGEVEGIRQRARRDAARR
jgi:hypothetical protein